MNVKLLSMTHDPWLLAYTTTRGSTTSKGFGSVFESPERFMPKAVRARIAELEAETSRSASIKRFEAEEIIEAEMRRLVTETLAAGHPVGRMLHFVFAVECSRSIGRQLLRSEVGVSKIEMSQRYVKLASPKTLVLMESVFHGPRAALEGYDHGAACDEYGALFEIPPHIFSEQGDLSKAWFQTRLAEVRQYRAEIEAGVSLEDARENLPNCTRTNILIEFSFEALQNFLGKRLCTRAQRPMRQLAKGIRKETLAQMPELAPLLTVKCLPDLICHEAKPDGCALLRENGGRVWRAEQARRILSHVKTADLLPLEML